MKNFVLFLRANKTMSPEAFNDPKEIELRAKWLEDIKAQDLVAYLGGTMPPIPTMASTIYANGSIVDGIHPEHNEFLTGFLIIKASDINSAKSIANSNPILKAGGSVEVREINLR